MVQILKMSYSGGNIIVEASSSTELVNCFIELYLFDFLKGQYFPTPNIRQAISSIHASSDSGIYRFKYEIPGNCKVKCIITDDSCIHALKERFIGDRFKIKIDTEQTEIGCLYKMKSNVSISKKMIFYKSPASETKINLPDNLIAGETLVFTIREKSFRPKFESHTDFMECFNIEG